MLLFQRYSFADYARKKTAQIMHNFSCLDKFLYTVVLVDKFPNCTTTPNHSFSSCN